MGLCSGLFLLFFSWQILVGSVNSTVYLGRIFRLTFCVGSKRFKGKKAVKALPLPSLSIGSSASNPVSTSGTGTLRSHRSAGSGPILGPTLQNLVDQLAKSSTESDIEEENKQDVSDLLVVKKNPLSKSSAKVEREKKLKHSASRSSLAEGDLEELTEIEIQDSLPTTSGAKNRASSLSPINLTLSTYYNNLPHVSYTPPCSP